MSTYTNQRIHFEVIAKKYREYVELYKQMNNGSEQGVTMFDDFYARYVYLHRYADATKVGKPGF